jgi:RNA polymerase sigma-54 factor
MPLLELKATIEQELSINPAIEEIPKDETEPETNPSDDPSLSKDDLKADKEDLDIQAQLEQIQGLEEASDASLRAQNEPDSGHAKNLADQQAYRESLITKRTTLADYLLEQSHLLNLSEKEEYIAFYIIGNIDSDRVLRLIF